MNDKQRSNGVGGESAVSIDENKLDMECVRLPSDYLKYASWAADLSRDVDEQKAKLELIEADLGKLIRDTPVKYGHTQDKLTEAALAALILRQPAYQTAQKALADTRHELDLVRAVVSALDHKKRTLTLLVELHGMGYFAAPKISPKGQEALMAENAKKARSRYHTED